MGLNPTRIDRIHDKLLAIESYAYKARHLPPEKEEELQKKIRAISATLNELNIYVNTPNEKGKAWGWWE